MEADSRFMTIVFTMPEPCEHEPQSITSMLCGGINRVHLRHPGMNADDMASILHLIPTELHSRISIHDHFTELIRLFPSLGVHLNSRAPQPPSSATFISRTCHSVSEAAGLSSLPLRYITLSPVYPSISKPGYTSSSSLLDAPSKFTGIPVIALGGVTPSRFSQLYRSGFAGAAMMGWAWQNCITQTIKDIKDAAIHI